MIQEYKFRVEREAEESKRKQIEADGIAAFQRTVSQGISESYLRWRGIEATLALAQSPNAKIVVIGSGKDGLPIILGNVDTPALATPAGRNASRHGGFRRNAAGGRFARRRPPSRRVASPTTPSAPPAARRASATAARRQCGAGPPTARSTGHPRSGEFE